MKRLTWSSRASSRPAATGMENVGFACPCSLRVKDAHGPNGVEQGNGGWPGPSDAERQIAGDLCRVAEMPEVPILLDICREASGMPFVAIILERRGRRILCAVSDVLGLGVRPGDELDGASVLEWVRNGHGRRDIRVQPEVSTCRSDAHDECGVHFAVPILRTDGMAFGVLCAVDPRDTGRRSGLKALFESIARLVAVGLDAQERKRKDRAVLIAERETAWLREQFIAVVGHDLRNPIAAVSAGMRMLRRHPTAETAATLLPEMQRSIRRMQQITDDLLDFARGRLGDGIPIDPRPVDLEPVLIDITREIERLSARSVERTFALRDAVSCDAQRIAQLLSNLLGNAVRYGDPHASIKVDAKHEKGRFRLAVTNHGAPIPEAVLPTLFAPFSRGDTAAKDSPQGLGLGLYIAAEIATAHDGWIDVSTDDRETTFVFTMPTARA